MVDFLSGRRGDKSQVRTLHRARDQLDGGAVKRIIKGDNPRL